MSPRTKEQNEDIRRRRIEQILSAAAEVYLIKGVTLEIRDVAAQAELGYGTVYHYYRNKHDLFGDMLEDALKAAREKLAAVFRSTGMPQQRLRRLCRSLLTLWLKRPAVFVLYKTLSENVPLVPSDRLRPLSDAFDAELYLPVVRILRDALPASSVSQVEQSANLLLAALVGCAGLYIHRRRMDLEADRVVDMLLGGILGREG